MCNSSDDIFLVHAIFLRHNLFLFHSHLHTFQIYVEQDSTLKSVITFFWLDTLKLNLENYGCVICFTNWLSCVMSFLYVNMSYSAFFYYLLLFRSAITKILSFITILSSDSTKICFNSCLLHNVTYNVTVFY